MSDGIRSVIYAKQQCLAVSEVSWSNYCSNAGKVLNASPPMALECPRMAYPDTDYGVCSYASYATVLKSPPLPSCN
jgi:hypothetical protein